MDNTAQIRVLCKARDYISLTLLVLYVLIIVSDSLCLQWSKRSRI